MINGIWSVILLIGFLYLAWIALKALWTGRLDYVGGKFTDFTSGAPLLRQQSPFKFWVTWFCIALISLLPLSIVLVRVISHAVFVDAQD